MHDVGSKLLRNEVGMIWTNEVVRGDDNQSFLSYSKRTTLSSKARTVQFCASCVRCLIGGAIGPHWPRLDEGTWRGDGKLYLFVTHKGAR